MNRGILIFSVAGLFLMAQLSFVTPYTLPMADEAPKIIFGDPQEALSSGDSWCPENSQATLSAGEYLHQGAPQTPLSSGDYWWAGTKRWGGIHEPTLVKSMKTVIKTPNGWPSSDDEYYVLLSAWVDSPDCATYVQIGISTINYPHDPSQDWGLTTSYTVDGRHWWNPNWGWIDEWEYVYEPHEMSLDKNTYHTFEMVIDDGDLTFNMYTSGVRRFTKTVDTGGNWLITSAWVYPSWRYWPWIPVLGYTLYEEILPDDVTPGFDFVFSGIYAGEVKWTYWHEYYQGDVPSEVDVYLPSPIYWVKILNS
ncbi:MAG: hypothetical protein ACFFD6_01075 [Candidatus Thorarchaeota archaeon]